MRIHHVFLQHVMFVHNLTSTSIYFIRPNPAFCLSLSLRSSYYSQVSRSQILIAVLFMAEIHQPVIVVYHSLSMFNQGSLYHPPKQCIIMEKSLKVTIDLSCLNLITTIYPIRGLTNTRYSQMIHPISSFLHRCEFDICHHFWPGLCCLGWCDLGYIHKRSPRTRSTWTVWLQHHSLPLRIAIIIIIIIIIIIMWSKGREWMTTLMQE